MQQDDGARVDAPQQLIEGLLLCGLGVLLPVHVGEAPEEGVVAELPGHLQVLYAVDPSGRPVESGHLFSRDLPVRILHAFQFPAKAFQCGDPGHIGVRGRVVAHGVSLLLHAPDQLRVIPDEGAYHEKGGRGVMLFQRIQDGGCVSVLVACVKCQVDGLLPRIPQVMGVVLRQFPGGGVSRRRLALLPEPEPPVSFRGGGRLPGGDKVCDLGGRMAGEESGGEEEGDLQKGQELFSRDHGRTSFCDAFAPAYAARPGNMCRIIRKAGWKKEDPVVYWR